MSQFRTPEPQRQKPSQQAERGVEGKPPQRLPNKEDPFARPGAKQFPTPREKAMPKQTDPMKPKETSQVTKAPDMSKVRPDGTLDEKQPEKVKVALKEVDAGEKPEPKQKLKPSAVPGVPPGSTTKKPITTNPDLIKEDKKPAVVTVGNRVGRAVGAVANVGKNIILAPVAIPLQFGKAIYGALFGR